MSLSGGDPSQCKDVFSYPVTLATIEVSGKPKDMNLPADPLPTPQGLPSIATMLSKKPDAVRNVAFEICGDVKAFMPPERRLPSCGWYFEKYDATYWGGTAFYNLEMMRDADDAGVPTGNTEMPLVNFKKEGLFDQTQPLFPDMIAGNYEEWTVYNRSFSDHPFHLHQNHVLITKINGITLPRRNGTTPWMSLVPCVSSPPARHSRTARATSMMLRRDRLPFGPICGDDYDGRSYCRTGECSRAIERCLTMFAPVASSLSARMRAPFPAF